MVKKRKIKQAQADKVRLMGEFLDTEIGKTAGIPLDCAATHITCIKSAFQNASGFYIMGRGIGRGDKMTFSEIHSVYTACLKDEDFSAFVMVRTGLKQASTSSKTPVEDKGALNGQETAQDGDE